MTRTDPTSDIGDTEESRQGQGRGRRPSPHDSLFRAVFSDPVHAQSLLRDQLPNNIAGLLADTPPRIVDGSFVDEDLRKSQADLLMEVDLASGGSAFVYVLVEHKSYPDAEVVLQVLGYMVSRLEGLRSGGSGPGRARCAGAVPAANHSVSGLFRPRAVEGSDRSGGYDRDHGTRHIA